MNIYLGSLVINKVTAPMFLSSCQECREIPDPASLVVLSNSPGGGIVSTCDYDGTPQVDGTGLTTINMLDIINTSHLI